MSGAAVLPLGDHLDEHCRPLVQPKLFTLIAADGSQTYPDRHGIAANYPLNTGVIVLRAGTGEAPSVNSIPEIFFEDADLDDEEGRMRSAEFISAERNRRELAALADLAEDERTALGGDLAVPIICLIDGPLRPWLRPDPTRPRRSTRSLSSLRSRWLACARARSQWAMRIVRAAPCSARPRVHRLPIENIMCEALRQGDFIQLTDRQLFADLAPNERTGLFEPNSDANDRYRVRSGDRIAFAYANFA